MQRITIRPIGSDPVVVCWHCHAPIDREMAVLAARYLHRADQPDTGVVEDWVECACGAYQNVRRLAEIRVEPLRRDA